MKFFHLLTPLFLFFLISNFGQSQGWVPQGQDINVGGLKLTTRSLEVSILDSQGKLVGQQVLNLNNQLNVGYLPKGIFFLKVLSEGRVYSEKFIR